MTCAVAGAARGGGGVLLSVKQMFLISRPDTSKERTHSQNWNNNLKIIKFYMINVQKCYDIIYYIVIPVLPMSMLNNSQVT